MTPAFSQQWREIRRQSIKTVKMAFQITKTFNYTSSKNELILYFIENNFFSLHVPSNCFHVFIDIFSTSQTFSAWQSWKKILIELFLEFPSNYFPWPKYPPKISAIFAVFRPSHHPCPLRGAKMAATKNFSIWRPFCEKIKSNLYSEW